MFKLRPTTAALTKLIFFLSFFFCLSAFGQDRNPAKFGKISAADLKTKSYSIDNNASAVIIADIGSSQVIGNLHGWFSIEFKHFKRIHILKESAYDLANVEVLLYRDGTGEEELKSLKAHTYNLENGKLVEGNIDIKKSIYTTAIDKNHIIKKFAFPGVKAGSIIEYEYTVSSDFITNLQPWRFQSNHPTLWSEYNVSIPEFLYYVFLQQGAIKKTQTTKQENFRVTDSRTASRSTSEPFIATVNDYRMLMKNVPAIKEESFVSTIENHVAKVEFQLAEYRSPLSQQTLMGDWEDVTETLLNDENFGGQLKKDNNWLNGEMSVILKDAKTDKEKAKNIFNYLQKNFTCTDHNKLYTEQSLRNVFKDKKGSEVEINLLLVTMFRKIGLTADAIMLSTRSHGYVFSNYPVVDRFNYVICRTLIDDKPVYLDASKRNLGFGQLDWECYNGYARVISEKASMADLSSDSIIESKTTTLMAFTDQKGETTGFVQQIPGAYESLLIKDKISEHGLKEYLKEVESEKPSDIEISNYKIESYPDADDKVYVKYDFKLNTEKKDIIYLDPMFGEGFTENPFPEEKRIYPIEMPYALDETFLSKMEVLNGYKIDQVPVSVRINLDQEGKSFFEYLVEISGSYISLRSRIKVHRSYFLPEEYKALREFFTIIVNKQNEKIILKKIK